MILCNLVSLPIASINLEGILTVPKEAQGIVLFAHGSGSSRTSPSIGAIVSRGGRPDLAKNSLPKVTSPTLLIVGGQDWGVIELNQQAYQELKSLKKLEIVPGATHLFEESGALEKVAELAVGWFKKYLPPKT